MNQPLLECVPNFSEGRDTAIIKAIEEAIRSVEGVALLDVDSGRDTNRTVMTFVGRPEQVCEAAFRAIAQAAELIDMRRHQGAHPRIGATDVCPLVPVSSITMEEAVQWAHSLARRVGEELGIPVYLYEYAATAPHRRNLADIRAGEYEGLPQKILKPEWKPDYGPVQFNAKSGATVIGARNFLIAYNVNLNTTSLRRANAVAFDVREKGRVKRIGDPLTGQIVYDDKGNPVYEPGLLKSVKAIGWYIPEYGCAQVSMNLTNPDVCDIHEAYETVKMQAEKRGLRVTGSELVGLIPKSSLLKAGRFYLKLQKRSLGVPDEEIIRMAVRSMGLDALRPFEIEKKVIEYAVSASQRKSHLVQSSVRKFVYETASESPAPGGGSVAALCGALGAALGTMVANLSAHKRGWDDRWEHFSQWAEKGHLLLNELLNLVDEDTEAFNQLRKAFQMPQSNEQEKAARTQAIQEATEKAAQVPLQVMRLAQQGLDVCEAMAREGLPASVSDAGCGALALEAATLGAGLNVRINCQNLADKELAQALIQEATSLEQKVKQKSAEVLQIVYSKIGLI
ncbi:MAG: glutamate formimidoyltransferase [Flavobacteriales bacterium]|nr:glutamate formimidoyltransferase [Flavobacteriales bacterium]MCX7768108.1 glutamate formimidoyltransferase [Flavobacteriales bacterium]MDW8409600.1 glutamate formimidoyltransferase [Flavobacteriales bacterium]